MTLKTAYRVLQKNDIQYQDYFDLCFIDTSDIQLKQAINRVKTYITIGR